MSFELPLKLADQLSASIRERWAGAWTEDDRRLVVGVAAAVCVHLFGLWVVMGGLSGLIPVWLSNALSPPIASGDPAGTVDGVAAEIIDAKEFDNRYISFSTGHDKADTEPTPQSHKSTPSQPAPPAQPPPAATADEETPPAPEPAPAPAKPSQEKPQPETKSSQQLTQAEIAEIMAASKLDLDGVTMSFSKAGSARLGEVSPFVRAVLRILKQNMPKSNGMRGSVVIQLVVSQSGDIEFLRVAQSSGRPELDRLVFMGVRGTRLVPPGKDTPQRDRMFQVTYEYD